MSFVNTCITLGVDWSTPRIDNDRQIFYGNLLNIERQREIDIRAAEALMNVNHAVVTDSIDEFVYSHVIISVLMTKQRKRKREQ